MASGIGAHGAQPDLDDHMTREIARKSSRAPTKTVPTIARTLPIMLLRAREAVMSRYRPILRKYGLTEQQWRVLRVLSEVAAIDTTRLAVRASLRGPSLSRILADFERARVISRRRIGADRRLVSVSIAAAGRKLIADVQPEAALARAEILRAIGARRYEDLIVRLTALEAALATARSTGAA